MAEPVLLDDCDPADVARWLPALEEGSVVLVRSPGTEAWVREPVAFGLVRLVTDPGDAAQVAAARAELEAQDVAVGDRALVLRLLRARLAGEPGLPDTAPHVLVVVLQGSDVPLATRANALLGTVAGRLTVWASSGVVAAGHLPESAEVVDIGGGAAAWWPARLERALVLRLPGLPLRAAGLMARTVGRLAPGSAGRTAVGLGERLSARGRRTGRLAAGLHRRWCAGLDRVGPALVARQALARRPATSPREQGVDVVVAPLEAQSLMWRLLRADPELSSRGSLNGAAVHELVRRRTRAWDASEVGRQADHDGLT